MPLPTARLLTAVATTAVLLAGCDGEVPEGADPALVDATATPQVGTCRDLTPADLSQPSNGSALVDCEDPHDAETYDAGELPGSLHDADRLDPRLDRWAYGQCSQALLQHLGADESVVMRSVLTWVWYRPSEKAWDEGARWYRCDVVGGGPESASLVDLPASTEGLLKDRPDDRWMVCGRGESFDDAARVTCAEPHDWRAVTTIKLGQPDAPYPGDQKAESTTRDFCSDSVDAWLGYPGDFDFGYTWFHRAEWDAGNRRSVCWARTPK